MKLNHHDLEALLKKELLTCKKEHDLLQIKSKFLGKKGYLTSLFSSLKDMPDKDRKELGAQLNQVKVVLDKAGCALYFSRSPIPFARDINGQVDIPWLTSNACYRHLGLYAYKADFLSAFSGLEPGSCHIKLLDGNAIITKLFFPYFSYKL